jgi:cytochrome c-type biogenesis protein
VELEALRAGLAQAGLPALAVGFLAGLAFSFNPVALAAIPVSLGYVTRARARTEAFLLGAMFIAGMIATHAALGAAAGLGGRWIEQLFGRYWGLVLGPLLVVLGLAWAGWLRLPWPAAGVRGWRASGPWSAFALGAPFAVAVCPACTPALVVLLGVAAAIGSPLFGLVLAVAFALGRAVPIAVGAWTIGALEGMRGLAGWRRAFEIAGGAALIASGLYLLNAFFVWIPELAA